MGSKQVNREKNGKINENMEKNGKIGKWGKVGIQGKNEKIRIQGIVENGKKIGEIQGKNGKIQANMGKQGEVEKQGEI